MLQGYKGPQRPTAKTYPSKNRRSPQVTVNKIKGMHRLRRRRGKRKTNMATQLARVAKMLSRSPSARNVCTTTKLSQSVAAGVTKPAVPGGGRSRGESSGQRRRRRSWRWSRGSRKTEGVKGVRAVTSEKRTAGSQILHSKPRGVKIDRTGIVSGELANEKKIVNNVGSNKHIRETERTGSGTHGGDRKTRTIADHDRGRTRGMGGRTKERMLA